VNRSEAGAQPTETVLLSFMQPNKWLRWSTIHSTHQSLDSQCAIAQSSEQARIELWKGPDSGNTALQKTHRRLVSFMRANSRCNRAKKSPKFDRLDSMVFVLITSQGSDLISERVKHAANLRRDRVSEGLRATSDRAQERRPALKAFKSLQGPDTPEDATYDCTYWYRPHAGLVTFCTPTCDDGVR